MKSRPAKTNLSMTRRKAIGRRGDPRGRLTRQEFESLESRLVLTGSPLAIDVNAAGAANPSDFVQVGNVAFFVAEDDVAGRELWQTDGTIAGTSRVADLATGTESSNPAQLTEFNGSLLFVADDGLQGAELWTTDGTAAGTVLVADIFPGQGTDSSPLSSSPADLTVFNNAVYFQATSAMGRELWVTDGTTSGTTELLDIATGTVTDGTDTVPRSSSPSQFIAADGQLFFTADDGVSGRELWATDGSASGTQLVLDIFPGTFVDGDNQTQPNTSLPSQLTEHNGEIYFVASDGTNGSELWKSDGTASGTQLVLDVNSGAANGVSAGDQIISLGNVVLFAATDGTSGTELWSSDGTEAGTAIVRDIRTGTASSLSQVRFVSAGDAVFFAADDGQSGTELWTSDGTEAGTVLVADINATGDASSMPQSLTAIGDQVFFTADNGFLGRELWESDGTAAGTMLVADILPGAASSNIVELTTLESTLLFAADDATGADLWSVDALADAPAIRAEADAYTVAEDDTLNVTVDGGVLANDSSGQSAVAVTQPANGTLTLNADGSFTYVPNADFSGSDAFTYQATDGTEQSNVATVAITVTAENDPPLVSTDFYLASEDTSLTVSADIGVLANDSDVDGDTLTVSLATAASNGTVDLSQDGSFVYTPDANFTGNDTFFYTVSDGTITSEPVEVTVQVASADDVPVAAADGYSLDEDQPLVVDAATGVLANDVDSDGDTLVASVVTQPTNGTLVLNDDGSFTYTPNAEFSGTDTFTYTASDGTNTSEEATVTLTVANVVDGPNVVDDSFTVGGDGGTQTFDVLSNDSDPDATGSLSITNVSTPSQGGTVTIDGNEISYTPNAGFFGTETFTYTVEDGAGEAATGTVTVNVADTSVGNRVSGFVYMDHDGSASREANETGIPGVQIELIGQDTSGVSVSRTTITRNDGSYQFEDVPAGTYSLTQTQPAALFDGGSSTDDSAASADGNVISNLSVAGDSTNNLFSESQLRAAYHSIVWFFAKQQSPQSMAEVFREMMATAEDDAGNTELARAIRSGETEGVDGGDGGDTVTPQANDDTYTTDVDQQLTVTAEAGVLGNDTDPNGDDLTATVVATTTNGTLNLSADGSFTYDPNSGFTGQDTFTYTASDGTNTSSTATVTITVSDSSSNTAPVAVVETYSVDEDQTLTVDVGNGVLSNDTDADGDTLATLVRSTTTNGTLNLAADGSFTYTPNVDFSGTDSFAYVATDGTADSNEVVVSITVNAINDAPVATDDTFSMAEDGSLSRSAQGGVLSNDTDADADTLTVSLVDGPSGGSLTLNDDGSFIFTPDADFNGDVTFVYEVSDGELTDQATVTITVTAAADAPVAVDDSFAMDEDATLAVDAAMSILANDTDVDGDALTAALVQDVANGTLALNSDGTFTYTPDANFAGTDTFTYRANDGTADSNVATVTISVTEIDDQGTIVLPTEFSDPSNVPTRTVGETFEIDVDVMDIDDDDYTYMLDLEASGIPADAAQPVIDPVTGVIQWTPTAAGRFAIRVIVVNGDRESDQETFLVDILASDVDTGA